MNYETPSYLDADGTGKVIGLFARCFQQAEPDLDLLLVVWPAHGVPVAALLDGADLLRRQVKEEGLLLETRASLGLQRRWLQQSRHDVVKGQILQLDVGKCRVDQMPGEQRKQQICSITIKLT